MKEPWIGFWHFLAGHVEADELPHETIIREVMEESGFMVKVEPEIVLDKLVELPKPKAILRYPVDGHFHVSNLFECRITGGRLIRTPDSDIEGIVEWHDPATVEVTPYVKYVIDNII